LWIKISKYFWPPPQNRKSGGEITHNLKLPSTQTSMDVVIPTTAKDYATLHECVASIFKYVADVRHIYLISKERPALHRLSSQDQERVKWVDEGCGPVTLQQSARHLGSRRMDLEGATNGVSENFHRLGWLFQQCIKLEASKWCGPQLSRRHLICDSDVVFFRPVTMVEDGVSLLSWQPDYFHAPYFEHVEKLTGGRVVRVDPHMSGIAHHMVFDEECLNALRKIVAATSHDGNVDGDDVDDDVATPLWQAFLQWVILPPSGTAAASEYELYFNFALSEFSDTHRARALRIRDNSGTFNVDSSSYLLKHCEHHDRMVGRRNPIEDALDVREWHFAAYHSRTLPIWQFLTIKDQMTKDRIRADPQIAINAMLPFKDKPMYTTTLHKEEIEVVDVVEEIGLESKEVEVAEVEVDEVEQTTTKEEEDSAVPADDLD